MGSAAHGCKPLKGEMITMSMYLFKLITLFGGLALFLFGMDVMGKALERTADLNALKSGELHESAAYVERFAKYKAKYAFPEEA